MLQQNNLDDFPLGGWLVHHIFFDPGGFVFQPHWIYCWHVSWFDIASDQVVAMVGGWFAAVIISVAATVIDRAKQIDEALASGDVEDVKTVSGVP